MIAVFCLGANCGPRAETLMRAARQVRDRLGEHGLAWFSDLYADRHTDEPGGATVNLLMGVPLTRGVDTGAIEVALKRIEDELGRERHPERKLPVAIDIDLVAIVDDKFVQWVPRYDPGTGFLFHGLSQLPSELIHRELEALANEREFSAKSNALGFYPLLSADFVQQVVAA